MDVVVRSVAILRNYFFRRHGTVASYIIGQWVRYSINTIHQYLLDTITKSTINLNLEKPKPFTRRDHSG